MPGLRHRGRGSRWSPCGGASDHEMMEYGLYVVYPHRNYHSRQGALSSSFMARFGVRPEWNVSDLYSQGVPLSPRCFATIPVATRPGVGSDGGRCGGGYGPSCGCGGGSCRFERATRNCCPGRRCNRSNGRRLDTLRPWRSRSSPNRQDGRCPEPLAPKGNFSIWLKSRRTRSPASPPKPGCAHDPPSFLPDARDLSKPM